MPIGRGGTSRETGKRQNADSFTAPDRDLRRCRWILAAVLKSATAAVRMADCGRRTSRLALRAGLCKGDVDRRRDRFQKTFGINVCEVEPIAVAVEVEAPTSRQHDRVDDDDGTPRFRLTRTQTEEALPVWCLRANPAITGWRQRLGVAVLNRFAERLHHGGKLKQ